MLLHEHPVNQAREANGDLPVNSLWFSAGGVLPAVLAAEPKNVFSNMPLLTGLACAANFPCQSLPVSAQAWAIQAAADSVLALENVERAEPDWFRPLLAMLYRRHIHHLELCFAVRDRVLTVQLHWYDLFRFWRRRKPLLNYFSA
jgi:hypothetical protein